MKGRRVVVPRISWYDIYLTDLALESIFIFIAVATVSSFLVTPFIDQDCSAASHNGQLGFYTASAHINAILRANEDCLATYVLRYAR